MPRSITADRLADILKPGQTVFAPGMAGQSPVFVRALADAPEAACGVHFVGVWLPGYNRVDYAGLHPEARATAFFLTADIHASFAAGRVAYHPLTYYAAFGHIRDRIPVDVALLHVSAPDANGRVSLGVANDFTPAILSRAAIKVAHVNAAMPFTRGAATLPWSALDYVVEEATPLPGGDDAGDPVYACIGAHLAPLVRDGDTLEVGIGRVQSVLDAFAGKRDLAFHTGAITDSVRRLADAGAIADREGAVTTGVAWGGEALYRFCADDGRVRFAPVGWTHDIATLSRIERFVAINGAIEVDLFGQVNAEMTGGRQISSAGGITDFMRGARLSAGGFAVIALPAEAKGGTLSRIVPQLEAGTAVSVARADADLVATEHGIADLRHLSLDERAHALIAVAAPAFRADLEAAWRDRRARL